jgi:hypothetical protein
MEKITGEETLSGGDEPGGLSSARSGVAMSRIDIPCSIILSFMTGNIIQIAYKNL